MPSDIELLVPIQDEAEPEVSIVVPALNEEQTIGEFVEWCLQGLRTAGVRGEVLIVDSSSDRTAERALAGGARVLRTPKRGLGRAYIDSIPYIRGAFVIMGDCDLTYEFRELKPFVDRFREGKEFVMGSRFRGYIEPGSMPPHHQYFGTPGTTWILNVVYSTNFTDIHCGMRGISRSALADMGLRSQGWEYASEMVIKAVQMELSRAEVPVKFYKDREGRLSHHRRTGWYSPWLAAWVNMRAMFVYGAAFFLIRPGAILSVLGLGLVLPLTMGPLTVGRVTFSLYSMLVGLGIAVTGLNLFQLGCVAEVIGDRTGRKREYWLNVFRYDRSVAFSVVLFITGMLLFSGLVREFISSGLTLLPELGLVKHSAVTGLLLIVVAFTNFVSTLVIHLSAIQTSFAGGGAGRRGSATSGQ